MSWLHDVMDTIVLGTIFVVVPIIALHFWVKRQHKREASMMIKPAPEFVLFELLWAALLPLAVILGFWVTG